MLTDGAKPRAMAVADSRFLTTARVRWVVVGLLAVHVGLLANLAVRYSPTVDEVGHLPAGLYTWEFGRFDVFRVNPPLVRTIAALPVWLAGPEYDWSSYRGGLTARPEWSLGRDLMRANGERSLSYFTWARWTLIPLSLLGGVVCFIWASELYGGAAGLTALTLWCFSPTVLAYGSLITPDLSAAAVGVTAAYSFWRWLRRPSGVRMLIAGLTLGLAALTKTTWILLFALWPLLWGAWVVVEGRRSRVEGRRADAPGAPDSPRIALHSSLSTLNAQRSTLDSQLSTFRRFGMLAVIVVLGVYVVNVGYGFDGTFQRLGEYRFVSRALSGEEFEEGETDVGGNRFEGTPLAWGPVPLPRDYVTGIDLQKWDFEKGKWSYLRGEWKRGGWWWYYLYAAAVKEPLGTWCLLGLAMVAAWRVPREGRDWRDTLVLLAPGLVLFVLVSSQTGFNRYLRYVLPAFPFVFIWGSQAVRLVERASLRWALPVGGAIVWSVASSLWVYPHSLSYFNEAAGGPAQGHEHLIDANVDWGQSLFELRDWLMAHPEAAPVGVACRAFVPLEVLGLEFAPVPDVPLPGWFVVSRHDRHRRSGAYDYFEELSPVDRIGESMDVYHVTPQDADRLRRVVSVR